MGDKSVKTLGSSIPFLSVLNTFSSSPSHRGQCWFFYFYFLDCTDYSAYTTLNLEEGGIRVSTLDANKIIKQMTLFHEKRHFSPLKVCRLLLSLIVVLYFLDRAVDRISSYLWQCTHWWSVHFSSGFLFQIWHSKRWKRENKNEYDNLTFTSLSQNPQTALGWYKSNVIDGWNITIHLEEFSFSEAEYWPGLFERWTTLSSW